MKKDQPQPYQPAKSLRHISVSLFYWQRYAEGLLLISIQQRI